MGNTYLKSIFFFVEKKSLLMTIYSINIAVRFLHILKLFWNIFFSSNEHNLVQTLFRTPYHY